MSKKFRETIGKSFHRMFLRISQFFLFLTAENSGFVDSRLGISSDEQVKSCDSFITISGIREKN